MIRAAIFLFPFALLAVYSVYAAFRYTRMIGNIFLSLVYRPNLDAPDRSFAAEQVTILDSADREMDALYAGPRSPEKIAIFCPESGAAKEHWEKYAYFLPRLGWAVLSLELTTSAEYEKRNSLSQWPTDIDVARVLTAVRWAKRAYPSVRDVALFGVSKGADVALAAAAEEPSVKAIVSDGLFSMKEIFRDYIRKWAPILVKPNLFGEHYPEWVVNLFAGLGFWYAQVRTGRRFVDVEKLLKERHVPLLLIHGAEDDYVPATHQAHLAKINAGREHARQLTVPKAKHNEAVIVAREAYEQLVGEFLETMIRK